MENKCYIDESFISDIGFDHIREWLKNHSKCNDNYYYFSQLIPSSNQELLEMEFLYTNEVLKSIERKENLIHEKLNDIAEILNLLKIENSYLQLEDVINIRDMAYYFLKIKNKTTIKNFKLWNKKINPIKNPSKITKTIGAIIDDQNNIKYNASKKLSSIIKLINSINGKINLQVKHELEKYNKLGYLRECKIIYRAEKLTLPVLTTFKNKVKGIIDGFSSSNQTCFIEPISLVELNNELNEAKIEKKKELVKILKKLTSEISLEKETLESIYQFLKYYDRHATIAMLASRLESIAPKFSKIFSLKKAINPLFTLNQKTYVPLNFESNSRHKTIVISGPNSGGKTIAMKSFGLYSVMAQSGLYIPAREAILPIFKFYLSDIGDKQSLDDDLSTFSAHMKQISTIIKKSNKESMIIIDEMGTGTDPEIGASLSISILNKLTINKAFNLCTTHLTPIKLWANSNLNAENASMEFNEETICPTFILKQGVPGPSYGIEIAQRMGIDKKIVKDASKNLNKKSFEMENLIRTINIKQKKLDEKINTINLKEGLLSKKIDDIETLKKNLDEQNKKIKKEQNKIIEKEIKPYRKKIELLVENIKNKNAEKSAIKEAKKFIDDTLIKTENIKIRQFQETINYSLGDYVQINDSSESGIIVNLNQKSKAATVEINNKKITVKTEHLNPIEKEKRKKKKNSISKYNVNFIDSNRLDVRGMRVDEALSTLDAFLDKAILSNLDAVDILHGKGTGALQKSIHKYLRDSKIVKHFDFATVDQGGTGITFVEISKK